MTGGAVCLTGRVGALGECQRTWKTVLAHCCRSCFFAREPPSRQQTWVFHQHRGDPSFSFGVRSADLARAAGRTREQHKRQTLNPCHPHATYHHCVHVCIITQYTNNEGWNEFRLPSPTPRLLPTERIFVYANGCIIHQHAC